VAAALLVGVDGCRGGWIAAWRAVDGPFGWRRVSRLAELLPRAGRPAVVAVDVPIGLPRLGGRACDAEARARLGARRCCVFTPPIRPMLAARTHAEASAIRRRLEGKGMSIQAWGIVPKIVEADRLLRAHPAYRAVVREVHPEVCFTVINGGRPIAEGKKSAAGHRRRVALLRRWCGDAIVRALGERRALGCEADDVVDAFATLWTAERIHRRQATTLPPNPPRDVCGLRMEIVV